MDQTTSCNVAGVAATFGWYGTCGYFSGGRVAFLHTGRQVASRQQRVHMKHQPNVVVTPQRSRKSSGPKLSVLSYTHNLSVRTTPRIKEERAFRSFVLFQGYLPLNRDHTSDDGFQYRHPTIPMLVFMMSR